MIEPSTGKKIPMNAADHYYTGVESVFNHKMYYVNLQPDAVVSAISTDLLDATQWESVFPREKESEEVDPLSNTQQANLLGLTSRRALTTVETVNSETPDDNWKPGIFIPMSWVRELTLSPQQYESRYPGGSKEIQYSDATVRFYADYSQPDLRVKEVIVSDHLDRDSEQTHILFKHRADKLRRRLIIPQDRASERSPAAINIPSYRLMHEWYDKGRTKDASFEGLREFIYEPGKERTMKFYWRSREDGLRLRNDVFHDEQTLHRSREEYRERPDRLRQRSAVYDRPRTGREANIHQAIVLTGVEAGLKEIKEYPRLEPIQISQKYTRNPSIPVERDVYKIKFTMPPANTNTVGEMSVIFHYPENSLIRPSRLFVKASSSVEDYIASSVYKKIVEPPVKVVTMPGVPPPSELDLHKERKWLSGMEAVCISEVRKKLDEAFDILLRRDQDQAQVQQVLSSYDTLRNRPLESEAARAQKLAEAKRREESRRDYLAPYIARMNIPSWVNGNYLSVTLNSDQSRQVRDEALLELKERLIQRGRIMQSRMDKEKEEFARRQAAFQKNGETAAIDGSRDAEEFAIYCKEATWRMKVLDERLSKHITLASEKYAQLAQRLAEDPRLAALYGH
ncbi:coiled-coil domain containing 135 [Angomonas deanei]|nr:coiled-coil domain containing 135 [Angomonas deanei]|eukprot:EPY34560.1 coiled-coil domain containing 135 [Angomonas deanei]